MTMLDKAQSKKVLYYDNEFLDADRFIPVLRGVYGVKLLLPACFVFISFTQQNQPALCLSPSHNRLMQKSWLSCIKLKIMVIQNNTKLQSNENFTHIKLDGICVQTQANSSVLFHEIAEGFLY